MPELTCTAAKIAAEMAIWVIARNYAFAAGGVTHVGGETYFASERACQGYIDAHYRCAHYYPLRLVLHKEDS